MAKYQNAVKEPKNLSSRIKYLRDYYFEGLTRKWNNEFAAYSTGTEWDLLYDETTYYIVPETYPFLAPFAAGVTQSAQILKQNAEFYKKSIVERKALFSKESITKYMPCEILPGDLLCGARFNAQYSMCLTEEESVERTKLVKTARESAFFIHDHGYGNSGATSGHLIPNHEKVLKIGFKGIYEELKVNYDKLSSNEKKSQKGAQLRAMMISCEMAKELAEKYSQLCIKMAEKSQDSVRKQELLIMAKNMEVPWLPAQDFYQAMQSIWFSHMLIMFDEKYPGPGVSFGRMDQYLYPYYKKSISDGMTEEFMKEILGCFWIKCNTVYDAQMRVGGNQGITAGFGQLINLSGMGRGGVDMTNDLTYLFLDVLDDISPILEPKPNVRLHKNSPEKLLDRLVEMVASSQGAPFLLNFDERSMAGMLRQAKKAKVEHLINLDNVHDYASVGCLENTMVGNDRSGTVDVNVNLLKAMELVYGQGKDFLPFYDEMTKSYSKIKQDSIKTGKLKSLDTFDKFYSAYKIQLQCVLERVIKNYDLTESIRAKYNPTPYLSLMVNGCAEKGLDVTQGGAELGFVTVEGITFATTVDSLLAIKYLVYDEKICTLKELVEALKANWKGYEILQAKALHKAPKYGRDDKVSDKFALDLMDFWAEQTWAYKTAATGRQFRPGMLSWNYWIGYGYILKASANGRPESQFLSNAICPSNGADINGPTSNSNSVGNVLGGKSENGDYLDYNNSLPNGASHTITFNTSMVKDDNHKEKFKAFIRGYIENGGTALQINILDPEVLKDAQAHPTDYRHLLVRITGYNAYFTSISRELQDEIISRESHRGF